MAVTSSLNKVFTMLSSKYPNFEKDLLNEVTLQKVALSIIKMRLEQEPRSVCREEWNCTNCTE